MKYKIKQWINALVDCIIKGVVVLSVIVVVGSIIFAPFDAYLAYYCGRQLYDFSAWVLWTFMAWYVAIWHVNGYAREFFGEDNVPDITDLEKEWFRGWFWIIVVPAGVIYFLEWTLVL